jgi:predicted aspartyl protease
VKISFVNDSLITQFTIVGAKKKDYSALVDTGATKSAIPLKDCKDLSLKYAGDYEPLTATGSQTFSMFDATLDLDGRLFDIQIMGLDIPIALLGLDILCHYKLSVDWSTNPKLAMAEDRP